MLCGPRVRRLVGPVPAFKPAQWNLLALALLCALARHHVPALRESLSETAAGGEGTGAGGGSRAGRARGLRAGGFSAAGAHPRVLDWVRRTGFEPAHLTALVDFLTSPEL